jgi:hypothetical protein
MNYRIVDSKGKEVIVHVNWLKKLHDQNPLKVTVPRRPERKVKQSDTDSQEEDELIQSHPIPCAKSPESPVEGQHEDTYLLEPDIPETPMAQRDPSQRFHYSMRVDPPYEPRNSPRSRRELTSTPFSPPKTRSKARLQL